MDKGHGGGAMFGAGWPQKAHVIAGAQMVQKRLQKRCFMRAHQVMHGSHARGRCGVAVREVVRVQRMSR